MKSSCSFRPGGFPLFVVAAFLSLLTARTLGECVRESACSCRDESTSELVSLFPLANSQGHAGLRAYNGSFVFEFNPCLNITSPICQDVAFCQHYTDAPQGTFYNLGTQASVQFSGSAADNNMAMQLQGKTTVGGHSTTRTTNINLFCNPTALTPVLSFVSEQGSTYTFNLTSHCACAGACHPPPEECVEDSINHCACRLNPSDGDQLVNIRTIDDPSSPLTCSVLDPSNNKTATIYYNPCSGITKGVTGCIGSTICLQEPDKVMVFGTPQSKQFGVDQEGNPTISYTEATATLVCDYTARHMPQLNATLRFAPDIGYHLVLEVRTICACPGACVSPPVSCTPIDDCSCQISEDGGVIRLHDLDNPLRPLQVHHATTSPAGQTFVYNPCSNFSIAGRNDACLEVAGCQFGGYATPDTGESSMGLQPTAQFRVSQEGVVTISYSQGDQGRQFSVILLCNKTLPVPLLSWLSENPQRNYHLQLESEYGCPVPKESIRP